MKFRSNIGPYWIMMLLMLLLSTYYVIAGIQMEGLGYEYAGFLLLFILLYFLFFWLFFGTVYYLKEDELEIKKAFLVHLHIPYASITSVEVSRTPLKAQEIQVEMIRNAALSASKVWIGYKDQGKNIGVYISPNHRKHFCSELESRRKKSVKKKRKQISSC